MLIKRPRWEYAEHANFSNDNLVERALRARQALRAKTSGELLTFMVDTRPLHSIYFSDLTPADAPYFAGHYRGENFQQLLEYEVFIAGYQGAIPLRVASEMHALGIQISDAVSDMDRLFGAPENVVSAEDKLVQLVRVATYFFVQFLSIHPYANGNGHMSRFALFALMGRFGFWRFKLPMHPRPHHPFDQAIGQYRRGVRQPLEQYMLSQL